MKQASVLTLLVILGSATAGLSAADPRDSAEAARVAEWVRALRPVDAERAHFALIGGLSSVHVGPAATRVIRSSGPAAFYRNATALEQAGRDIERRASTYAVPLAAGGLLWHRDVQNFPWGLVEPSRGERRWEVTDAIVGSLDSHGIRYVGTVMPYADWELHAAGLGVTSDEMCLRLLSQDFFYLDFGDRMGRLKDVDAWFAMLGDLVERYDGDGIDDMPGLRHGIRYWQIHNEPEGDRCGGFRNDAPAFAELMRRSRDAVRAACPSCLVLQGGAGIPLWRGETIGGGSFWREFAEAGGASSVDIIAVHYNDGKVDGGSIENFETQVGRLRQLLGEDKPAWATEFGVVVDFGGQFHALAEDEAGAWYMRFYAAGLAAGVERFFSDAPSFIRHPDGTILLPYYVNRLMEAKIGSFTRAEKIGEGQYRFDVGGRSVWIVWRGVPADVPSRVQVTDMYGDASVTEAAAVHPSESMPLFLESVEVRRRPSRR